MGRYDVPAILDKITEVSEANKVSWIGYSQGTSQMFYALATIEEKIASKLERAVMLAPCPLQDPWFDADTHKKLFDVLYHEGVYVANDDLYETHLANLCRTVPDGSKYPQDQYVLACETYKTMLGLGLWPVKSLDLFS